MPLGQRRYRPRDLARQFRREGVAAQHDDQLGREDEADHGAHRRILQRALLELDEIDVEHHHHEQEQHGHRADIDDQQDDGEELRARQQEERCRVEERQDQVEHGVHGVAGRDDHEGRRDRDEGEQIEEDRLESCQHGVPPVPFKSGRAALPLSGRARLRAANPRVS